tara:strand:- start:77 stop:322 length:246 start_codon:yes stop_codon:yes gene_type:complete
MEYIKTIATLKQADAFLDVIGYNSEEFKQNVKDSLKEIEAAISVTRCCAELPKISLEQAITKAKPNLDKITDVDKHIDSIR